MLVSCLLMTESAPQFSTLDYIRSYQEGVYHCAVTFTSSPLSSSEALDFVPEVEVPTTAQTAISSQQTDLYRLAEIIHDDQSESSVVSQARVASDDEATLHAREQLLTMQAPELIRLCQQANITVDELAVWRRKGGKNNQELRMYDLDEMGIDSIALRSRLVTQLFSRFNLLGNSGVESLLVYQKDVSGLPETHKTVAAGAKIEKLGQRRVGEWLNNWLVKFSADGIINREVVPVISWAVSGNKNTSYWENTKRFDWLGSSVKFDERTLTLTHYSPTLGAAVLAREAGVDEPLKKLTSPKVMKAIMDSNNFLRLEHVIVSSPNELKWHTRRWADAETWFAETPPRQWPTVGRRISL